MSVIVITVDGTDITSNVMLESASFELQYGAVPGSFQFTCKDEASALSFTTGKEVVLTVDGTKMWGGYVTQITLTHAFKADDTTAPYPNRLFILKGVDYNIIFDKRVARDASAPTAERPNPYLQYLDLFDASTFDGDLLTYFLDNYIDSTGFDTSTYMDNVRQLPGDEDGQGSYVQQGDLLRRQFEDFSIWSGAIWYIDADKKFHYHAVEDTASSWGFSDVPNGTLYGFRELEATEDGSIIINDALIWGGKAFSPTSDTVFSRVQDAASQSLHGRWQLGETHFGEDNFGLQEGVLNRGNILVYGDQGVSGPNRGLNNPSWIISLAWFAQDVPGLLHPGDLVTIELQVFGITKVLPLRSLRISFPSGKEDGSTYVRFDGTFSLQPDDPKALWTYLREQEQRITTITIGTATNASTSTIFGALGIFTPSPSPEGSTTVFSIPFGYIPGTLQVYRNGMIQRSGIDVLETDSDNGKFVVTNAPSSAETLYVICRTLTS